MKNKRFNFRVTERRYEKLNLIAQEKEKSLASLFDDWIDSLPEPRKEPIKASAHDAARAVIKSLKYGVRSCEESSSEVFGISLIISCSTFKLHNLDGQDACPTRF